MLDLLFLAAALLFLAYIWLTLNNSYWLKAGVPYLEPQLFFGNIRDVILMQKTIGQVYQEIYRKLDKPVGGFFKLRRPALMVRDPGLVREVLEEQFSCFHDNDLHVRPDTEPVLAANPFIAKGKTWKPIRQAMESSLRSSKVRPMIPMMLEVCKEMCKYIEGCTNKTIDVQEVSGRLVSDVVATCSFGEEASSFRPEPGPFRRMTKRLFSPGLRANAAILSALYAPLVTTVFKLRIVGRRVTNYFTEVVTNICRFRVREGVVRPDFLQQLININKESEACGEGQVYKMEEIAAHCMTFLVCGFYQTAVSLSFCLWELGRHPEDQRRARQEVLSVASNPDQFDHKALAAFTFLDRVIKESLRLHPPQGAISRVCTSPTQLGGLPVAEGTPVVVPLLALHTDPAHFQDPASFRPDRWLDRALADSPAYLPFGRGPRACPGKEFSETVLKLSLACLLASYSWTSPKDQSNLPVDPFNAFLATATHGVYCTFKHL